MRKGWAALAVLVGAQAFAHDADVIYVEAAAAETSGEVLEVMTLTAQTLGQLAPVDADGDGVLTQADLDARADAVRAGVWEQAWVTAQGVRCSRDLERAVLRTGYVELSARLHCGPGELRQDFRFLSVLPTNYRVVLGTQVDGEKNRAFAQGTLTALTITRLERRAFDGGRFRAGVRDGLHRALAAEALAFVLAVMLLVGWSLRRQLAVPAVGLLALALGTAVGWREPWPAVCLAAVSFGLWAVRRRPAGVAALAWAGFLALGLQRGGGDLSTGSGLWAGTAALTGAVAALGGVVAHRLQGRPALRDRLALGLAAVAVAAVGFRLAGLAGP